jgi:hypothetical protein
MSALFEVRQSPPGIMPDRLFFVRFRTEKPDAAPHI